MKSIKISSISIKLGVILLTLFMILMFIAEAVLYLFFLDFYTDEVVEELTGQSNAYAGVLSDHLEDTTLRHVVLMESTSPQMVMVLDESNNQLAASGDLLQLPEEYIKEVINHASLDYGPIITSDWKNEDYFIAQSMIVQNQMDVGKVIMFSPTQPVKQAVSILRATFIVIGLLTFIISGLLIFIISYKVVQPLLKIIKVTKLIAEGKHDWELQITGSDEIADLSYAVKDMSKKLQDYYVQRNRFIADISHELRTPLTYFKGYVEVLLKDIVTSEEDKKKYLNLLFTQSGQLQRLVQDLFDLATLEQDRFILKPARTSIETVMVNALEFMGPSIEQKGISIDSKLSPIPLYVLGDEQRLQQVVVNLLENAKKYTSEGGRITVITIKSEDHCVIEISDTGIGIPEKDISHIWDRLYRVENSRSRDTGGAGIGLTISKKIISLHNGEINVNSKEGEGTTFQVKLPLY
jgi:two-component system sensor histidine kinase BaeS